MQRRWTDVRAVFAIGMMTLVAGCGEHRPTRVVISGQVCIDGKPLTHGSIMLVPKGARPSTGQLDEQGRFALTCYDGQDGAVPGQHRVAVIANEPLGGDSIRWLAPKKYADYHTSGLTVDIAEPTDSLRFDLTWAGGKPFIEKVGR
jgi:hypothetical protein